MGPQAAINAVFYNQIQAIDDEAEREAVRRRRSARSTPRTSTSSTSPRSWSSTPWSSPSDLRAELIRRFAHGGEQGPLLRRAAQPGHACLSRSGVERAGHLDEVVERRRVGERVAAGRLLGRGAHQDPLDRHLEHLAAERARHLGDLRRPRRGRGAASSCSRTRRAISARRSSSSSAPSRRTTKSGIQPSVPGRGTSTTSASTISSTPSTAR